jgi:hypothetical protein
MQEQFQSFISSELRDKQGRKYSKMDKRAKDKLVRSPGENREG